MNLRALTTPAMLALTHGWLNDPEIYDEVTSHELGAAVFDHLRTTCNELSEQSYRYERVVAEIARLSQELKTLSADFSRKARAFHNHLDALADATDDPQRASFYRDFKVLYFPRGLSITKRSYLEMGGASMRLAQYATPERMSELQSIRVGEYTLAELFGDWVEVGKAINKHTQQRARLKASIAQRGSLATQAGKATLRNKWMRALRLVLGAIDDLPLPARIRERFLAPLLNVLNGQRRPESAGLGARSDVDAGSNMNAAVAAADINAADEVAENGVRGAEVTNRVMSRTGGAGGDTTAMGTVSSMVKRAGRAQSGNGQAQPRHRSAPTRHDYDEDIPALRPVIESLEESSNPMT